jgi:phage terminase large subunit
VSIATQKRTATRLPSRTLESEIWFSWNPRLEKNAVDKFLRKNKPDNAIVVQADWRDNPWFPDVLEVERQHDLKVYPERYDHIWEGTYARAFEGAYFARQLNEARQQKRVGLFRSVEHLMRPARNDMEA